MRKDGEIPLASVEMRIKSENPTVCVFKAIYEVSNIPFFFPTVEKNLGQASRSDYLVEFVGNANDKLNKRITSLFLEKGGRTP